MEAFCFRWGGNDMLSPLFCSAHPPDVYSAGTSLIDLTLRRRKAPVQQAKLLM